MKKITTLLSIILLISFSFELKAQEETKTDKSEFTVSGEVNARTEYTHGYKTPFPEFYDFTQEYNYFADPTLKTNQRTRLNFDYKTDKMKFGVVLQDVRTWGSQAQLTKNEDYAVSVHEAWGEINFTPEFSLKAGRMELAYDDHRILGNVGWAQQARSHDLALFKYEVKDGIKAHLGIAFHGGPYDGADAYKAMQFLWINGKAGNLAYSFLALNNGLQEAGLWFDGVTMQGIKDGNAYSQTIGTHLVYKTGNLSLTANAYYQMGKKAAFWVDEKSLVGTGMSSSDFGLASESGQGQKISAYNVALDVMYKMNDNFKAGLGFEMLSGNDLTDQNRTDENAFAPLYGTNHKFNGWMDYFYVGNHASSVGLTDINLKLIYTKGKFFAKLIPHYFLPAGKATYTDTDGNTQDMGALGTEIDFWAGYNFIPKVASIQFGYSHMLATDSMYALKGVDMTNKGTNNWAWIMMVLKPKFLNVKK